MVESLGEGDLDRLLKVLHRAFDGKDAKMWYAGVAALHRIAPRISERLAGLLRNCSTYSVCS